MTERLVGEPDEVREIWAPAFLMSGVGTIWRRIGWSYPSGYEVREVSLYMTVK